LDAVDYAMLALYFVTVLGAGVAARRSIRTSIDFFLSGRSLPAWVTGLAFISANLGALEILGMAANGAQYGMMTVHYYWVGVRINLWTGLGMLVLGALFLVWQWWRPSEPPQAAERDDRSPGSERA
jgi:Na+/proline symporter